MKTTSLKIFCLTCLLLFNSSACSAEKELGAINPEWPKTNFDKRSVGLDEIISGGPPKDGIPAIDDPSFIDFESADAWLNDKEPVIALSVVYVSRAYPLQILIYHEIVNDVIANTPVSVTFCPLCNAAIVFDRRVGGEVLDFGTTGKLRKSDMVMYDRQTESWWQQFVGEAVVGHYTGITLKQIHASIVAYDAFKQHFPQGKILSRDTGHSRPYGRNPYRGYDAIDSKPFLYFDPLDQRLPAMERVIGISLGTTNKIYPLSKLENESIIHDDVDGSPIVIFSQNGTLSSLDKTVIVDSRAVPSSIAYRAEVNGTSLNFSLKRGEIIDHQTRSTWNLFGRATSGPLKGSQLKPVDSGVHFAFAWLAFRPDSLIY